MKHKWLPLILCAILLLPSCGTSEPAIVPEAQLQNDLLSNAAFKEAVEEASLEITDFKIIKRQTTPEKKIDKVWVAVDAQTNNDSSDRLFTVGAHLECVMVYGLYNDGWILDEIVTEDDSWSFVPLSGFSEEFAAELALIEDGEFIRNEVDLDNSVQYITYRRTVPNRYCESVYVMQDEYIFSHDGEWLLNDQRTLDKSETWNIEGTFSGIQYDKPVDIWLKFDGKTLQWQEAGYSGYSASLGDGLIDVSNTSIAQYALSYTPCYYVSEVQNGYSVEFANVDWGNIQYATTGEHTFIFIGKNHICWTRGNMTGNKADHGARTVLYWTTGELYPK